MGQLRATPRLLIRELFLLSMSLAPLGLLVVKHWFDFFFIFSSVLALLLLRAGKWEMIRTISTLPFNGIHVLGLTLFTPFVAVLGAQLLRHQFQPQNFDAPLRFLLGLPILGALIQERLRLVRWMGLLFLLSLMITAATLHFLPRADWVIHEPERMTSFFVDPLTFGRLTLELGVVGWLACPRKFAELSYPGQNLPKRSSRPVPDANSWEKSAGWRGTVERCWPSLAAVLALILAAGSGSRTGWLALPVLVGLYWKYRSRSGNDRTKKWLPVAGIVMVLLGVTLAFPRFTHRVDQGWHEVESYQWQGHNSDSSTALRISFLRIGWRLFELRPLSGWGDRGFAPELENPEFAAYSTPNARQFVLNAGFHNEIMTNMVRSGVWGLIASWLLFGVPFSLFWLQWRKRGYRDVGALAGVCLVILDLVSGFTTEVYNLKFTAAFYAYWVVVLCATHFCPVTGTPSEMNS